MGYRVTVIVLLYEPKWEKLNLTLQSILSQKGVDFEVVFCDDGSKTQLWERIEGAFEGEGESIPYSFVKNAENRGTVANYISGLERAQGEYVYATSPGDFLYDDSTLADFYQFANENNEDIVFGNALHYAPTTGELLTGVFLPHRPQLYAREQPLALKRTAFFFREYINGATYFRRREVAIECAKAIAPYCKYTEDTPTTMYALLSGYRPAYLNRAMVFYEDGAGISTSGEDKWSKIIVGEIQATKDFLQAKFPEDKDLRAVNRVTNATNKVQKALRLLCNPALALRIIKITLTKKYDISKDDRLSEYRQKLREKLGREE